MAKEMTFNEHCTWLGKEMQKWEDSQKTWDKNSRRRMNYHFRKELDDNLRLAIIEAKKTGIEKGTIDDLKKAVGL